MFSIEMFPAGHGDALWIEYGDRNRPNRVLIDGGTAPTYDFLRARIAALPRRERRFELLVVTHVDADHIEGVVRLLQDRSLGLTFGDVWFNGWQHLRPDTLGGPAGELLGALIQLHKLPWNLAFKEGPVVVRDGEPLPAHELPGGLRLTLIAPTPPELERLSKVWEREVRKAGIEPGVARDALDWLERSPRLQVPADVLGGPRIDIEELAAAKAAPDTSEPNASSITLLAEFEGKQALLAGDAVPSVFRPAVDRLLRDRGVDRLPIDAFKLPHHGSKRNVTSDVLELLPTDRYLFSTNGAIFSHPDPEAVARVLLAGSDLRLSFNYRTEDNEMWDDDSLRRRRRYTTEFPEPDRLGLRVVL